MTFSAADGITVMPLSDDKKAWWHQNDAVARAKNHRQKGINRQ